MLAHQHSLDYDRLPSFFIAFDVYDRHEGRFWSRSALHEALEKHTTIPMVPSIYNGPVTGPDQLRALLDTSSAFRSGDGKYVEGVYLRIDDEDDGPWLQLRAKLVRADFVQHINEGEHWTKKTARMNKIAW